jgi:hypothetical protein
VDRLISETLTKLQAVVEEKEVPQFDTPEPPSFDIRNQYQWQDPERTVLVGLTADETSEYFRLQELWLRDRSQAHQDRDTTKVITA